MGPFWEETKAACEPLGLDPVVLYAMLWKESSYNPWAMRYEPLFKWTLAHRDWASRLGLSPETEMLAQKSSWGLGQIMGAVAREHGFRGHLTELVQPKINLELCAKHLKKKLVVYGSIEAAVSAYNQGDNRKTPGGMYRNQVSYVDPVFRKAREIRKAIEDGNGLPSVASASGDPRDKKSQG